MHETRGSTQTVTVPLPYRYRTVTVPLPYRTPPRKSSSQKPSFGRIKMRVRAARVCAKACRRAAAHGRSAVVILKAAKHKQETTLTVPKQMHRRTTIFAPTRQHNHRPVLSRAGRSSCCQPPPSSPQHPQRPSTSPAATTLWSRKKRPRPGRGSKASTNTPPGPRLAARSARQRGSGGARPARAGQKQEGRGSHHRQDEGPSQPDAGRLPASRRPVGAQTCSAILDRDLTKMAEKLHDNELYGTDCTDELVSFFARWGVSTLKGALGYRRSRASGRSLI